MPFSLTRRDAVKSLTALAVPSPKRFVGVTVMPEFLQNEGVDRVLDNLTQRAGVTAVATSPYVAIPADERTGAREPPIDAGAGSVRLLDRSLWGKRELFIKTAPSYTPDLRIYEGLHYRPAPATELTRQEGDVVGQFIRAARQRGIKVYLQVQAAIPPGYRVQFGGADAADQPLLPSGKQPSKRLANNGSLASVDILKYTQALLRDLCAAYPEVNGFRLDWPEYPPYFLTAAFLDFSDPARRAAERLGFPFSQMQKDAQLRWTQLHGGLTNRELEAWLSGPASPEKALFNNAGMQQTVRFKSQLVNEFLSNCRAVLRQEAGSQMELIPNAFPTPLSAISGINYATASKHCHGISSKLYTMHWPMILRFYAAELLEANKGLDESLLVRALNHILDLADPATMTKLADCRYPEPNEPHPASAAAQRRKIQSAQRAAGKVPVYALAHGYGPAEDFAARFRIAYQASGGLVWVNRYGYLSDQKLESMKS